MTHDTSGPTLPEPSAFYDPDSSCWRMSGGMFPSDSMPSLATFPAWGMTRGGELYELPTPEPPTGERASSSLLPTPVADHSRGLAQPGTDYASLPNVAISLLPTPAVNDMGAGKTPEAWDEWTDRMQAAHGNGNGHGKSLSIEALRLLPTPVAMDATGARQSTALNPRSPHDTLTDWAWKHEAWPADHERDNRIWVRTSEWEGAWYDPEDAPTDYRSRGEPTSPPSDAGSD